MNLLKDLYIIMNLLKDLYIIMNLLKDLYIIMNLLKDLYILECKIFVEFSYEDYLIKFVLF